MTLAHDEAGDLVSYDAQGSASDLGFSYDAWGLTTSGTAAGTTASYVLDPLGRIASRSQGAETIAYDYAAGTEDAVRSVATGGANPGTTTFAFTPAGPLASSKAGVTQVYLQDLHGDVVASIVPGASSLSSSAWYSAYGERTALSGTPPVLGYQGDVTDPLTGTVDMLTRNYLPMLGRFTSRDVLSGDPSDPPSLNQFVYATGSPVTFSDPTGMCPPTDPDCPGTEGNGDGGIQLDDGDGGTETSTDNRPTTAVGVDDPFTHVNIYLYARMRAAYGSVMDWGNLRYAARAASEFGVDFRTLVALMIIEGGGRQSLGNLSQLGAGVYEQAQILGQMMLGHGNPSIGIMQMQFGTYRDTMLNHPALGGEFGGPLASRALFLLRLQDQRTAIRFAAAHLSDINSELSPADRGDPAILAGVYNGGIRRYQNQYLLFGAFGSTADNYVANFRSPSGVYAQLDLLF